jgi:hypothetical protein
MVNDNWRRTRSLHTNQFGSACLVPPLTHSIKDIIANQDETHGVRHKIVARCFMNWTISIKL